MPCIFLSLPFPAEVTFFLIHGQKSSFTLVLFLVKLRILLRNLHLFPHFWWVSNEWGVIPIYSELVAIIRMIHLFLCVRCKYIFPNVFNEYDPIPSIYPPFFYLQKGFSFFREELFAISSKRENCYLYYFSFCNF